MGFAQIRSLTLSVSRFLSVFKQQHVSHHLGDVTGPQHGSRQMETGTVRPCHVGSMMMS